MTLPWGGLDGAAVKGPGSLHPLLSQTQGEIRTQALGARGGCLLVVHGCMQGYEGGCVHGCMRGRVGWHMHAWVGEWMGGFVGTYVDKCVVHTCLRGSPRMRVWVRACVHGCVCLCMEDVQVYIHFLFRHLPYFFETGSLTKPGGRPFS